MPHDACYRSACRQAVRYSNPLRLECIYQHETCCKGDDDVSHSYSILVGYSCSLLCRSSRHEHTQQAAHFCYGFSTEVQCKYSFFLHLARQKNSETSQTVVLDVLAYILLCS